MSQEESSVTPAAAAAAPDPETPKTEQITLALLSDVKRLVEVAISRGAYKPEELSAVGKIYDTYKNALAAANTSA